MTFSGQSETKSVTLVTEERDQHYTLTPLAQLTCRILPWIGDKPEIYTIFCIKAWYEQVKEERRQIFTAASPRGSQWQMESLELISGLQHKQPDTKTHQLTHCLSSSLSAHHICSVQIISAQFQLQVPNVLCRAQIKQSTQSGPVLGLSVTKSATWSKWPRTFPPPPFTKTWSNWSDSPISIIKSRTLSY